MTVLYKRCSINCCILSHLIIIIISALYGNASGMRRQSIRRQTPMWTPIWCSPHKKSDCLAVVSDGLPPSASASKFLFRELSRMTQSLVTCCCPSSPYGQKTSMTTKRGHQETTNTTFLAGLISTTAYVILLYNNLFIYLKMTPLKTFCSNQPQYSTDSSSDWE